MKSKLLQWRLLLALLYFSYLSNVTYAQTNCASVTSSQIVSTPAYCQGGGIIAVPALEDGFFTLEDVVGNSVNPAPNSSNRFTSVQAGSYVVKLHCPGASATVDFPVSVANSWSQLGLDLGSSSTCPGDGVITAQGKNGYGGSGNTYRYAYWSEADGGPGRSDASLIYSAAIAAESPFNASGLTPGRYYVRVKDLCDNFYTQSILVTPTQQQAKMNVSVGEWVCEGMSRKIEGFLTNIHNEILSGGGVGNGTYTYTVDLVSSCESANPSTRLVDNKLITTREDMIFSIPATTINQMYRITVRSACDGVVYEECRTLENPLVAEHFVNPLCSPGVNGGMIRYTLNAFGQNEHRPFDNGQLGTITIVSTNPSIDPIEYTNVGNSYEIDLPADILPATFTYTSYCGLVRSTQIDNGFGANRLWAHPNFDCVSPGQANIAAYIGGNLVGLGESGTVYELIKVGTSTPVATVTGLTYANNNHILFPNISLSQGDRFKVRVVPASGGGAGDCEPSETPEWVVYDANPNLIFTIDPQIDIACDDGSASLTFNPIVNEGLWVSANLKLQGGGYDQWGYSHRNLPAGTYDYTVTLAGISTGCTPPSITGVIVIQDAETDPVITRTLAVTCQPLNEGPQPTGSAYLSFTGLGPFDVYVRKSTESSFPSTPTASNVTSEYTIPNLQNGTTYYVQIVDRCGKSATQQVTINPLSPRITTNTLQPCVNSPYALEGVEYPTASYVWEKLVGESWELVGNSRIHNFANYEADDDGTYRLTVDILDGCVVRQTVLVLNSERCDLPFALGSLGDYVWYDNNSDGKQDASELPAPGVTVNLEGYVGPLDVNGVATATDLAVPSNWAPMGTTTTDGSGHYQFKDLENGYYRVEFVKDGYGFTTQKVDGGDSNNRENNNDSNAGPDGYSNPVRIEVSFASGDVRRDNPTIDAGLVPKGELPVKLGSFAAKRTEEGYVQLAWTTTEEMSSSHFDVQQSGDGKSWQTLGTRKARGMSAVDASYTFVDEAPNSGLNYYRLKMVDLDGTFEFSNAVSVKFEGGVSATSLYPNPVRHTLHIKDDFRSKVSQVAVFDANGRLVLSRAHYNSGDGIPVEGLRDGLYVVRLTLANGVVEVKRMVVSNR